MRRIAPATLATLLVLATTPALSAVTVVEEPTPVEIANERVEVPEAGLAMSFPADWRVRIPMASRESEIQNADGEPIYMTTVVTANAPDGRWCDVDAYLDLRASLVEHTNGYVNYLLRVHGANAPITVTEADLPTGPAFQVVMLDLDSGRLWIMYLFDGPVAEDGTLDRFLLTCVADTDAAPYWQEVAASAEVFAPDASSSPEPSPAS